MSKKRTIIKKYRDKKKPLSWYQHAIGFSRKCWTEKPDTAVDLASWKRRIENILEVTPCYGYRKVTHALRRTGEIVNHKKVMRIMRLTGLKQKKRKFKPRTTDSRHKLRIFPNLIKDIIPLYPSHIRVTDITYVRLQSDFCYVAIVLDIFTRKVVGWSIAMHMKKELVIEVLTTALLVGTPMYHHSDRGGQYCANVYVKILEDLGVKVSMADTIEKVFAISVNERVNIINDLQTFAMANSLEKWGARVVSEMCV